MAGFWGLLRLVRFILVAFILRLYSGPVKCSHAHGFDARLYPENEVEVALICHSSSKDVGHINYPLARRPWESAVSDTRGQLSHESGGRLSRRLLQAPLPTQVPPSSAPPLHQFLAPTEVVLPPPPASQSPINPVLPPLPAPSQPSLPPSLPPLLAPFQASLPPSQLPPSPTQLSPSKSFPLLTPRLPPSKLPPAPTPQLSPFSMPPLPALFQPMPPPAGAPAPSPSPSLQDLLGLEHQAVLFFKGELTADPTGVFKNWNVSSNPNPCNWYGIQCGDAGESAGRITSLCLPYRKLEGALTRYIQNLAYLETLDLGGNHLTGSIPEEIGALKQLKVLRLSGNSFSGPFPRNLSSCLQIEELDVGGCGFTGAIPTWLGRAAALRHLHLGGNKLIGDVPMSLLNCTSLEFLNISWNNLTGSVASTVGNLVRLQTHLDISHNRFSGSIPPTLGNLRDLVGINLSGNAFTGTVPQSIGNCSKLQSLDLSDNQLSGTLPESLSLLANLKHTLNLSHNAIGGLIPSSLGALHNLATLDLSSNNLSGPVPETIANLSSLVFFNVSLNHLTGPLPDTGIFRNLTTASFLGNPNLCGRLAERLCPSEIVFGPPAASYPLNHHKRGGPALTTIIGAAAEGVVVLIFLILLAGYLVHRRRPAQAGTVVLYSKYFKALNLTAEEIQAATSFAESTSGSLSRTLSGNIRRAVGCSSIEKAVLPDGTVFAVKQWGIAKFRKKERCTLDAAMLALSRIRHRNLVRLMGYSMNPTTMAVLLEYMPNGSLDLHLHPPGHHTCQLKWSERLRIIMGITAGLVYLHHETCGSVVTHCDLTATNVLLDSDMEPKLVDFGISSLFKRRNSEGSTAASWICSSAGYIPPEYGSSSEFTKAGDVYSYGVLLLEIITGKRPTSEDSLAVGVSSLPTWVRSLHAQEREQYAIDMGLFQSADEAQINQMLHILKAAILCSSHAPSERPNMLQILVNLQELPESLPQVLVPVDAAPAPGGCNTSHNEDN